MTKDFVLITDDNYCLPTIVCINSIINSLGVSYQGITIHVCTFGLKSDNESKITNLSTGSVTVRVDLFDINKYEGLISRVFQKSHVTPTALIKFELPNYFSDLNSLLYLDSDIIVKGDLSALLEMDISDYYLAASYELWKFVLAQKYTLTNRVGDFFFNSGVMLLNLRLMREANLSEKLWDYKLNKAKTKLMDQESLNAVCIPNVKPLSIVWNFNPIFLNKVYLKDIEKVYHSMYRSVFELENDVRIVHYVGKFDKPWVYKHARMRSHWDNSYNQVFPNHTLDLQEDVATNKSHTFTDRIKQYGFRGMLSFIIYSIKLKIRSIC